MAISRKRKKCPFFSSRKIGRWTRMVCYCPSEVPCPDPECKVYLESEEAEQVDRA